MSSIKRKLKIIRYDGAKKPLLRGSDRRVTGGITRRCRLCCRYRRLVLSHVVPRWAYTWIRKEAGGKPSEASYPTYGVTVAEQDGRKHYLLCRECDNFIGGGENYARMLMTAQNYKQLKKIHVIAPGVTEYWHGVNFDLIRRYVFGTMLRSHYCPSAPFRHIRFRPETVKSIRRNIINHKAVETDFLLTAVRFHTRHSPGADAKAMVSANYTADDVYGEAFLLLAGGWEWQVFFNDRNQCKYMVALRRPFKRSELLYAPELCSQESRVVRSLRTRESGTAITGCTRFDQENRRARELSIDKTLTTVGFNLTSWQQLKGIISNEHEGSRRHI